MQKTISFITDTLHVTAGQTIFEQCCGIGTMSLAIAQNNIKTIGVDIIPDYISRAQKKAQENRLNCLFYAENAYHFKTKTLCDGAINWWTSFAYDPDDTVNIKMLNRVHESLKPGGKFILDFMNSQKSKHTFKKTKTTTEHYNHNGIHSIWRSEYHKKTNMITKSWAVEKTDGSISTLKQGGGVKCYEPKDFERLFSEAGFKNLHFLGSINGETYTKDSPRLIIVAEKA